MYKTDVDGYVGAQVRRDIRTASEFGSAQSGATAVEFGLVVVPFLMMIFGVINAAMYFFTVNSLDRGVEDASRQIRTGEYRTNGTNGQPLTVSDFRTAVCNASKAGGGNIDCNNLSILIKNNGSSWTNLGAQSCQTAGTLSPSTGTAAGAEALSTLAGGSDTVVLVTACYVWDLPRYLPFLSFTNFGQSMLIQSSTAFRTEPW